MQVLTRLSISVIVLFICSCSHHPALENRGNAMDRLREELDYIFDDPEFQNAYWGVVIQSLSNGQYLYLRNENKGFMPASNMKIFTTATALAKLSPEYQFSTNLVSTGSIDENGILQGDIIIRGSGDPSITGRFHENNILAVFENWIDSLKQAGVKKITGDIIGDDDYFEDEKLGTGWEWDDQSDYYAAQISALSFNDNCMDIIFSPGDSLGAIAQYRLEPETGYVFINCEVVTVEPERETGIVFHRLPGTNQVTITGNISINRENKRDWFSVENPTLFSVYIFRELLERHDIEVTGIARDIDELENYAYLDNEHHILARYTSPPLHEIIKAVNKVSQNLYAELLMRTLGAIYTGTGDTRSSIIVYKDFFSSIGINPNAIGVADGSGLSRRDLVTPKQVSTLLKAMWKHKYSNYFYESLPIAGIDGTIKNRMKKTAAANNVRAKTGYIGRVRCLSGYVSTKDGEDLVFSMLVNNYTVPTSMANNIQDLVCERLANFSRN